MLASSPVSRVAGILKEEWDAGKGGSGFSFSDLMADDAGVRFAAAATRDDNAAAQMQRRLISGDVRIDDVFPPAEDLPEGIPHRELQERFGGVGGAGYRQMTQELTRRLATCSLLR